MATPSNPEPSVFRPFLPNAPAQRAPSSSSETGQAGVRAYLITGGRAAAPLAYETMLASVQSGSGEPEHFERARILEVCSEGQALSVAEVAAKLQLPIGVVRVLASDLVNAGRLIAHQATSDQTSDVTLLTRLIDGVRAL